MNATCNQPAIDACAANEPKELNGSPGFSSKILAPRFDYCRDRKRVMWNALSASRQQSIKIGRSRLLVGMLVTVWFANSPGIVAQEQFVRREYTIKAGILAVLGKCVLWPPGAAPASGEPLTVGILGKDPFVENGINQLDRVAANESLKGHSIVVKRFKTVQDFEPCHILFVSNEVADHKTENTVQERVEAVRRAIGGSTVLVVCESAGLARQGAIANLLFDQSTNLIRLEINPDAASRAGLKLAPDLLRLSLVQIVRDFKK
jgi:hypothetical protein